MGLPILTAHSRITLLALSIGASILASTRMLRRVFAIKLVPDPAPPTTANMISFDASPPRMARESLGREYCPIIGNLFGKAAITFFLGRADHVKQIRSEERRVGKECRSR